MYCVVISYWSTHLNWHQYILAIFGCLNFRISLKYSCQLDVYVQPCGVCGAVPILMLNEQKFRCSIWLLYCQMPYSMGHIIMKGQADRCLLSMLLLKMTYVHLSKYNTHLWKLIETLITAFRHKQARQQHKGSICIHFFIY